MAASLVFLLAGLQGLTPETYWWHVAVGEFTAHWQAIPDEQLFNMTVDSDRLWVHTSWLGAVILAILHEIAGAELNLLVRNLAIAFTTGIVLYAIARRCASLQAVALSSGIVATVFVFFAGVEPHTLTMPAVAFAVVGAFVLFDHPDRFWWALPLPLTALVVINLDYATAVSLVGFGLVVGLEMMRRSTDARNRTRIYISAAIAASTLVGLAGFAYGPGYWATAFSDAFGSPFSTSSLPVALLLAAAMPCLVRHPHRFASTAALSITAAVAVAAPSTVALFAIVVCLVVAPVWDKLHADRQPYRLSKPHLAAGLIVAVVAIALQPGTASRTPVLTTLDSDLRTSPPLAGIIDTDRPVRCAEQLRTTGRPVRVFHRPDDAGFLLYHLLDREHPHALLFDDPRRLTSEEYHRAADRLRDDPGDLDLLDGLHIDAVVVPHRKYPELVDRLQDDPHWYDLRPQDDGPYTCYLDISPP